MGPRIFKRKGVYYCWVRKQHGGTRKLSTGIAAPGRGASSEDQAKARRSAESVAVDLQHRELDPDRAAQEKASLQDALRILIRDLEAEAKSGEAKTRAKRKKKLSTETLKYYREKCGSLIAGLTELLQRSPRALVFLREVKASVVDDYITMRRDHGASDSTIGKEMNVWKRAMKIAKRRGWWTKDLDDVFPDFSAASNTIERWCSPEELHKLYAAIVRVPDGRKPDFTMEQRSALFGRFAAGEQLGDLATELGISYPTAKRYIRPFRDAAGFVPPRGRPPGAPSDELAGDRDDEEVTGRELFAVIGFSIATSAEWSAIWRARREDIADDLRLVKVRGSKNVNRVDRMVPVEFFPFALLLGFARHCGDGTEADAEGHFLFDVRHKAAFRRRLRAACVRAGIPSLSPNDLRRSHAKWLRLAGVSPAVIAPSMGHVDSRMVELRYGRATAEELAPVQRTQLTNATWVSDAVAKSSGLLMGGPPANLLPAAPSPTTENPTNNEGTSLSVGLMEAPGPDLESAALPTELNP